MRKLVMAALIAAGALPAIVPAAATAQSREELRRDRQDIREERRELREAQRYGDRGDIREERREYRDARREYREDVRDRYGRDRYGRDDWRRYRQSNRALYTRGNWRAPFRYNQFRPGVRIGAPYYAQRYWISDPYRYHLPRPLGYQRWVRHYNDVLLIDTRRGVVVDVLNGFYF
jgi:Ni/Co efflux regulator RcnB